MPRRYRRAARRRIGSLCVTIGALMLLAAIALLAYNRWDDWRAGNEVVKAQDALNAAVEAREQNSWQYVEDDPDELSVVEIDGYEYIGTLSISRFGLELPVMAEWSYAGLKIAPGRYSGSVATDDLVICGHNYARHFGSLKDLDEGDEVTFTDVNGNIYYYVVNEVLTLQPTDIEEMLADGGVTWDLTLFTCTYNGQTRVTVRLSREE